VRQAVPKNLFEKFICSHNSYPDMVIKTILLKTVMTLTYIFWKISNFQVTFSATRTDLSGLLSLKKSRSDNQDILNKICVRFDLKYQELNPYFSM